VVEINNPSYFLEMLKKNWVEQPSSFLGKVELKRVKYTRGNLVKPNKYLMAPSDITYTQKLKKYSNEYEYRFVFWCQMPFKQDPPLNDYLYLNICASDNVLRLINKTYTTIA
jgi:hypothetical protein